MELFPPDEELCRSLEELLFSKKLVKIKERRPTVSADELMQLPLFQVMDQ